MNTEKQRKPRGRYQTRLSKLADCRRFLAKVIRQLDANEIDCNQARALVYGVTSLGQIIEKSDLESRIKALEEAASNDT